MPGLKNKLIYMLWAWLLAGTLNILAACLLAYKIPPDKILMFIASGLYGKDAFKGGASMVWQGLLFHYLIAGFFSILLFVTYPKLIKLFQNQYALGIFYGFFIWVCMNLLVLPVTNIPKTSARFTVESIATGTAALIICIGIPVAMIAGRYYKKYPY